MSTTATTIDVECVTEDASLGGVMLFERLVIPPRVADLHVEIQSRCGPNSGSIEFLVDVEQHAGWRTIYKCRLGHLDAFQSGFFTNMGWTSLRVRAWNARIARISATIRVCMRTAGDAYGGVESIPTSVRASVTEEVGPDRLIDVG